VNPGISCVARKLARTPRVKKEKKKEKKRMTVGTEQKLQWSKVVGTRKHSED